MSLLVTLLAWFTGGGAATAAARNSLVDQDGKPFAFADLAGQTVVLNFVFTRCPSICPTQVQALSSVRRELPAALAPRVRFVSVSVDPAWDTPEVLRRFAASQAIEGAGWSLVTGSATDIAELERQYSAGITTDGDAQPSHRIAVYLLDATGRLVQTYTGPDLDRKRLVREIATVDRLFGVRR